MRAGKIQQMKRMDLGMSIKMPKRNEMGLERNKHGVMNNMVTMIWVLCINLINFINT